MQASGSTQDTTVPSCNGAVTSGSSATFFGEGVIDASDTFYIADNETASSKPRACQVSTFGTLYAVTSAGVLAHAAPLAGPVAGAVALGGRTRGGDATRLRRGVQPHDPGPPVGGPSSTAKLNASPVIDVAHNRVYVADNAGSLFALNLSTGALDATFNGTGTAPLTGGTQSSPVLDTAGNLYVVDSTGALFGFTPSGSTLFSVNTEIGIIARDHLLETIWGYDFSGDSRTVDVHVRWLREQIEDDPSNPRHIVTVRGIGYRFEANPS